jgi:hypothetical protein
MNLSAYLGAASLSGVGYQFYNANETVNGSRITAGITDAGGGWYSVDTTIPAGAVSIRWDSTGTPSAVAREYFLSEQVWGKTMTELAAVPVVTASTLSALQWMFLLTRNKITQTSTTQLLRNDADSATIGTSTVSDDGTTFIRNEFS